MIALTWLLRSFILQDIHNIDVIRFAFVWRWLRLLILSRLASISNHLALSDLIFARSCESCFFGILIRSIEVLRFILLIHKSCYLILRALQELINLALPLMFDWIISSLYTWWVHRVMGPSTPGTFSSSHLYSWLRSWWSWRSCS